ncbi:MAG: hypothetical protein NC548_65645 [Lachnospiraceae bacterium]|nr:hypothetical protein [Lachnospiraceae bacterium]
MDYSLKEVLEEEIRCEIEELSTFDAGSEEKSQAIENVTKLYKLKLNEDEAAAHKRDERVRVSEQTKDRYVRIGIAAAELILPLAFYASWMKKGFKFEETNTFTSTTFKGLFNRFRPTKK